MTTNRWMHMVQQRLAAGDSVAGFPFEIRLHVDQRDAKIPRDIGDHVVPSVR